MNKFIAMLAFALLQLATGPAAQACVFNNGMLAQLDSSKSFKTTEATAAVFPTNLFKAYEAYVDTLNESACKNSIVQKKIQHVKTGVIYTAFYTNEDDCDGGNSYGVIVEGTEPNAKKAIAVIQDSDISCL